MPAAFSAQWLTNSVWPPRCRTATGWRVDTWSRSAAVNCRPSFSLVSSWKKPSTHWPGGVMAARAFSLSMIDWMATNSTSNGLPTSTSYSSTSPTAWLWQSMKPGVTAAPARSSTRVLLPARDFSSSPPIAMMRPAFTAMALARGRAGSMVMMRALVSSRSASPSCAAARAAQLAQNGVAAAAASRRRRLVIGLVSPAHGRLLVAGRARGNLGAGGGRKIRYKNSLL